MSLGFLPHCLLQTLRGELAKRELLWNSTRRMFRSLTLPSSSPSISLFFPFHRIGSEVYIRVTGTTIRGSSDYTCAALRLDAPWYRATIPPWFYFMTVPAYIAGLAARNGQPLLRWQTVVMMVIGSAGESLALFSSRIKSKRSSPILFFVSDRLLRQLLQWKSLRWTARHHLYVRQLRCWGVGGNLREVHEGIGVRCHCEFRSLLLFALIFPHFFPFDSKHLRSQASSCNSQVECYKEVFCDRLPFRRRPRRPLSRVGTASLLSSFPYR